MRVIYEKRSELREYLIFLMNTCCGKAQPTVCGLSLGQVVLGCVRLQADQAMGSFSSLLIDSRGPSVLWVVPARGRQAWAVSGR